MSDLSAAQVIAEAVDERGALDCTRDESAWGHGTMGPDDFVQVDGPEFAADILAALAAAGYAVVRVPDEKVPSPALIEAAYIAQDDLSTPPTWAIGAAAEVIQAYIDGQGHTTVHVLGHPTAAQAAEADQ